MGKSTGISALAAGAAAAVATQHLFVLPAGRGLAPASAPSAAHSAAPSSAVLRPASLAAALAGAAGASAALRLPRRATETAEEPAPPPPFDPAKQLGVTQPLGFFDPLGFSKVGDEEGFRNLRSAEMKHGRVAMMAAVGALSQSFFQLPGFEAVPKGLGAVTSAPGTYGFVLLFLVSGALELLLWKEDPSKGVDSVGDFGNPLNLGDGQSPAEAEEMRNRELNNGRAAMFAAIGIIAAELVSGKTALAQLLG